MALSLAAATPIDSINPPASTPLFARQPIFDRDMKLFAYELLFRSSDENEAFVDNADRASSSTLLRAYTDMCIEDVVGEHKAFVNFTRSLLLSKPPYSPQQLVIEVLEDEAIDSELIEALKKLSAQGYTIALDDFTLTPESRQLLKYASIVKLDVLALTPEQLQEHANYLKFLDITLVAEKVETHEMLEECKALGFDLFQGYFLSRPQMVKGKKGSENKQAAMQLLSRLSDPDIEVKDIERLISQDPGLSYKLLKLINSSAFGLSRTIESLQQAITLLGLAKIKSWIYLLTLANMDGKPQELCVAAMVRARMCQMLAEASGINNGDSFFTVGLLSMIDAFLDSSLENLLEKLTLSDNLNRALLHHQGDEGLVLNIAKNYEKGLWDSIDWQYLGKQEVDQDAVARIYSESLSWVNESMGVLA